MLEITAAARAADRKRESNDMTQQTTPRQRRRRSWLHRNSLTLACFVLFGLLCFLLGCWIGGAFSGGETAETTEQARSLPVPSDTTQGAALQSEPVRTTEPIITTTEAPRPTDIQDTIDDSTTRTVYLTFDDGPGKYTFEVLDILDRYDVKATFFNVGYYVDRYPENTAEIMKRGHLVACHSYTHEMDQTYASADAFMNEIEQWKTAVMNACGRLPDRICVRFPGGSTTGYAKDIAAEIKQRIINLGYRWFDWNAGNNDKYPKGNVNDLPKAEYFMASYRECMDWYKNKDNATVILLTHETERATVDTLAEMLQDLKDRGYSFKTLDHHPDWND